MKRIVGIWGLLLSCLLFTNVHIYGQEDFTFPNLNVQYDVIKNEGICYGHENITGLMGKSLRAFIAWSRELTGKDYDVLMFNLLPPYPPTTIEIPEDRRVRVPAPDPEGELKTKRLESEINQYRFEVYPQYSDCDMHELLDGNKILVNVTLSLALVSLGEVDIRLIAYIPYEKEDTGNLKYYLITMDYSYTLLVSLKKYQGNTPDEKINSFVEKEIKRKYNSSSDEFRFNFYTSPKWDVKIRFSDAYLVTFDKTDFPNKIEDIFSWR